MEQFKTLNYKQQTTAEVKDKLLSHRENAIIFSPCKCGDVVAGFNYIALSYIFWVNFPGGSRPGRAGGCWWASGSFTEGEGGWGGGKKGEIIKNKPVQKIYSTLPVVRGGGSKL